MIPSPERLQETQLGALGVPSRGLIYWYNATNVRKRDDSYDRVAHGTRQETRHYDSYYVIYYIIVRHPESYLDTTDITAPRPPVWPYSYVSVDHAASRRYGRCQGSSFDPPGLCTHTWQPQVLRLIRSGGLPNNASNGVLPSSTRVAVRFFNHAACRNASPQ